MNGNEKRNPKRYKKPRVKIDAADLQRLHDIQGGQSVSHLSQKTGLPYMLIYNIVHGRVQSVSNRHYQLLFRQAAQPRKQLKVDATYFRALVDLWLYLNDDSTRADLYRQLYQLSPGQRVDHRIFNGKVRSIEAELETRMEQKFATAGVDRQLLYSWLEEFEAIPSNDMVPYKRIKPLLEYLQQHLDLPPNAILNQSIVRYENGVLKRVSRKVYERALTLKQQTETALKQSRARDRQKIKDEIVGGKAGYTLYSDIRDELQFLRRTAGKSAKHYLGRGPWTYEAGKAKRIASWRARKILRDCDRFIGRSTTLTMTELPESRRMMWLRNITSLLAARSAQLLSGQDGVDFEKRILKPSHTRDEYNKQYHGFTPFDRAPGVLGMRRKAFDLMVAKNCEIFRTVGRYAKRWYLSDLYLQEISKRKNFDLISTKYEILSKKLQRERQINTCMN